MPPSLFSVQDGITLSPPIPVKRHQWLRRFVSVLGKPGKVVDLKARFRHGSVMLVYPSQEPAGNEEMLPKTMF